MTQRRGWAGGVGLSVLVTGGCATAAPRPVQAPVPVPATWQSSSGVVGVSGPAEDLSRWWQSLSDPLLSSLVERAIAGSPDLRSAQARLRSARASRRLAGKDLLPSLSASTSGGVTKTSGESGSAKREQYDAGLDASWEVDVFGGTRKAVSAAQADLEATEAILHDTQVSLVAEVALDYVDLRSSQARLEIAQANLVRQTETLDLTRWRAEAGLTSSLDVEQSRANLEQTRSQIPTIEAGVLASENRLATLLGQVPGALHAELAGPGAIPQVPASLAVGIPADTLRQRPDVRAAERTLAAAVARLSQAKTARLPSLRLSGSLSASAATVGGLFDGATTVASLLAGLTAPIFDRGKIRQQIEIQDAAREQALAAYEKAVLTALEDAENALVSLATVRRRYESLATAAEAARNAALLARHRYTAGLADFQTVLDTERSVLSIEDSLKSSEAESASALIRLYKALGGGWTPAPVAETNPRPQSEGK